MLETVIFSLIKGLPFSIKKKLIEENMCPKKALANLKTSLIGVNSKTGFKILNQINSNSILAKAEKIVQDCIENDIKIIPYWNGFYPKDLIHCIDAPFLIYMKGEKNPNNQNLISIVGTRNCTDYGLKEVKKILKYLKPYPIGIVSGLAYGIDICTHRTANEFDIVNYAVLGSGINNIYPKKHLKESEKIMENGMLISEYTPNEGPRTYHFPRRNRIIAGVSKCTIVIESKKTGGAMITGRLANDYSRDVFAVPGNNHQEYSSGSNLLIQRHQATILNHPEQIIEALNIKRVENKTTLIHNKKNLSKEEELVLSIISKNNEMSINEIQIKSSLKTSFLNFVLTNLEIKQYIQPNLGNFYKIKF
ncbi:DNA-processing protein DprA [Flavobacteriales bacterium]|nr:DNA-processing protein DprA [Flavobacteriales bacterium]